jgi:hypothetical protein
MICLINTSFSAKLAKSGEKLLVKEDLLIIMCIQFLITKDAFSTTQYSAVAIDHV